MPPVIGLTFERRPLSGLQVCTLQGRNSPFRCECREAEDAGGNENVFVVVVSRLLFRRPKYPELWDEATGGDAEGRSLRFPVVPIFRSQREKFNTFVGRGTWATHTLCPPRGGCEKDTLKTTVNKTDFICTI